MLWTRDLNLGASPMCKTTELARDRARTGAALPRDPRQSPRRCSHKERRPRRAEEGKVVQKKKGDVGAGAMNTGTRPRSPLSPGSRSTVPRWPNRPVDDGFRGDPVTRRGASTRLRRRGCLPPGGRTSQPWSPHAGPAPRETPVLRLREQDTERSHSTARL